MDHAIETVFTTETCTVLHVVYSTDPYMMTFPADLRVSPVKSALFKMTAEKLNFSIIFLLLLILDRFFFILLTAKVNL